MMGLTMSGRFDDLGFEQFRALATEPGLSRHERVGFPDDYREGAEPRIFADILGKMPSLMRRGACVLEIGPGCSDLPRLLVEHAAALGQTVHFVDSPEMLTHLPTPSFVRLWPGRYPQDVGDLLQTLRGKVDVVLAYSVLQYVFVEGNLWDFLDRTLGLLTEGGEILFGDLPNQGMRKRFFSSAAGRRSHRSFTGRDEDPHVQFNQLEPGQIDDSVVLALLSRARSQGFHAWALPQAAELPMANRREDLLIRRP